MWQEKGRTRVTVRLRGCFANLHILICSCIFYFIFVHCIGCMGDMVLYIGMKDEMKVGRQVFPSEEYGGESG